MVDIPIDADVSQAVRKMQEAMQTIQQVARAAAKGVEGVANSYDKAAVSAARFNAEAKKVLQAVENDRAKAMEEMAKRMTAAQDRRINIQNEQADRRAAMANLAKASQAPTIGEQAGRVGQAFKETFTKANLIQEGGDAAVAVVKNFGPMAAGLAAVTAALWLAKSAIEAHSQYVSKQGDLSAEMSKRRIQLGQDAASLGLSGEDLANVQTVSKGGLLSVERRESVLHDVAQRNNARPYGAPRLSREGFKKILEASDRTGLDLSSVADAPWAVDGNIDQAIDMEIKRRGADLGAKDSAGNWLAKTPRDYAPESRFDAQLSKINDENAKTADPTIGINERIYQARQNRIKNQGILPWMEHVAEEYTHYFTPELSGEMAVQREVQGGHLSAQVLAELKEANKQRAEQLKASAPKPPKPAIGRVGD